NTIPILSNILLKAADGHVNFTSTDLDLTLLSQAQARVSRPGSVTVPARKLFDLIRNLPEADVVLKLTENSYLGVTCERSSFRLVAQPAEDFPTVPKVEGKGEVSLPLSTWKRFSRKVFYAVSAEETRFQLMGALGNDKVAIVSRAALQGALRRVALFSSERSRGVKLSFEKGLLTVASASQELGEGTETLDVAYDAEPIAIGLNAQYLLDFLEEAET